MTRHPITDRQVAELPVHGGRAELLEDIMRTPVEHLDSTQGVRDDAFAKPPRRTRALATFAAAVAVVATVAGLAAWRIPHDAGSARPDGSTYADRSDGTPAAPSTSVGHAPSSAGDQLSRPAPSVPGGAYVALDQSGWEVTSVYEDSQGTDLFYQRGDAVLDLTTYPEGEYASYVADRNADASSAGQLTLLGREAHEWAYAEDDHAVIRSPEGDVFLEVRGTGMSESAFRAALADLVQTDEAGFAGSLPEGVVTPYNRDEAIGHLLRGVDTPPGFTADDVTMTGFNDAYQSAAQVAGAVGCAWINVWSGGTAADKHAAVEAFGGSRSWPLLRAIAAEGGYSSGFWDIADELRTGHDDKGNPVEAGALKSAICS
jgi:hypothetical protein